MTAIHAATDEIKAGIVEVLRTIHDPEIPVNIYDLGLIYALEVYGDGNVRILMTLTTPGCPVAQEFPATVEAAVRRVPGIMDVTVEIVWEPPWTAERMSEPARLQLGFL